MTKSNLVTIVVLVAGWCVSLYLFKLYIFHKIENTGAAISFSTLPDTPNDTPDSSGVTDTLQNMVSPAEAQRAAAAGNASSGNLGQLPVSVQEMLLEEKTVHGKSSFEKTSIFAVPGNQCPHGSSPYEGPEKFGARKQEIIYCSFFRTTIAIPKSENDSCPDGMEVYRSSDHIEDIEKSEFLYCQTKR